MKVLGMQTLAALTCGLPIWAGALTLDIPLEILTKPAINQVPNLTLQFPRVEAVSQLQSWMTQQRLEASRFELAMISPQTEPDAVLTAGQPDSSVPARPWPNPEERTDLKQAVALPDSRIRLENMARSVHRKSQSTERRSKRLGRGRPDWCPLRLG